MFIEQIIEYELRRPRPLAVHAPITSYFHDKTKICKENFPVDYCLLLKYCMRQCIMLRIRPYSTSAFIEFVTRNLVQSIVLYCQWSAVYFTSR